MNLERKNMNDTEIYIPSEIKKLIKGRSYEIDSIGLSGSTVIKLRDMVLKISETNKAFRNEVNAMRWLEGKLPVPRVIYHTEEGGKGYLLMSRVNGLMGCDRYYLERPDELKCLLADTLKALWNVDISDCPTHQSLDDDLLRAEDNVRRGMVSFEDVDKWLLADGGFTSFESLLKWLNKAKPEIEPVLSHGDLSLPNLFFENGQLTGIIDLGDMGIGDRWRDIAICLRSFKHNLEGRHGIKTFPDYDVCAMFDELGIAPCADKIKYWLLLDELF